MKYNLALSLAMAATSASAHNDINYLPFIPEHTQIIQQATGDLNDDGVNDHVFILAEQRQGANTEPAPGLNFDQIEILFGTPSGYHKVLLTDDMIPDQMGSEDDPEECISPYINIHHGSLILTLTNYRSAGSWDASDRIYTFKYINHEFSLIGYDFASYSRATGHRDYKESINYLTGKKKISSSTRSEENSILKDTWTDIKNHIHVNLSNIDLDCGRQGDKACLGFN